MHQTALQLESFDTQRKQRYQSRRQFLWLCLVMPSIPLDVFSLPTSHATRPFAVVSNDQTAPSVVACNQAARSDGIQVGMSLSAAWAMQPELLVRERRAYKEHEYLVRIATVLSRYSPKLSLEMPNAVLLEIQGSLSLFGGLDALRDRISHDLREMGVFSIQAIAPASRAALWLARAREEVAITRTEDLPARLGRLALPCTGWPETMLKRLAGMGLRNVHDVLRLPRDGFARRFGQRYLRELDYALSRAPEIRQLFEPPQGFAAVQDLVYEVENLALLRPVITCLVTELGRVLEARSLGVQEFFVHFWHRDASPTEVKIGLLKLSRDTQRLLQLIDERLQQVSFPGPVIAIGLQAVQLTVLAGRDGNLFRTLRSKDNWIELIDRLRARLGYDVVHGIALHPDHRPEQAWRQVEPGTGNPVACAANRPLWLLEQPRQLQVIDGQPRSDGPLKLLSGPERIESGWWDGSDVARDYFTARTPQGTVAWIYRERRNPERWYLHGLFG